jgi:hypothetical protein
LHGSGKFNLPTGYPPLACPSPPTHAAAGFQGAFASRGIHFHDIFLPHDYPREWVLDENRSWNEQYLLRALLMHSSAFRVLFGCSYAFWRFPELVRVALAHPQGHAFAGGSFWIERI